ncbi:MAG: CCA tRNA nucleotidyltransferase, partial [Rhodospirillaceae bacterium]|nr:CCA tRNA nucleotidyltransferase [Rhodospirillaceae bacterium]
RGGPDAAALAACAAAAPGIAGLSGERVSAEVFKLLAAANPLPSLQLMAEAGVLSQILPDGFDLDGLARSDNDPLRRLSAIASAGAAAIAKRLRLSKQQASRLNFLIDPPAKLSPEIARPALRQLLYDHGANQISDLALQQGVPELLPRIDEATPPPFPLKGSDALALGMHAGPEIGNILRSLEDEWRANDFAASRDELLAALTDLKMDKG